MENPKLSDLLADIHVGMAKTLLDKINNGTATAADLSVARAFLRDNGVQGSMERNQPMRALAEALPFAAEA